MTLSLAPHPGSSMCSLPSHRQKAIVEGCIIHAMPITTPSVYFQLAVHTPLYGVHVYAPLRGAVRVLSTNPELIDVAVSPPSPEAVRPLSLLWRRRHGFVSIIL